MEIERMLRLPEVRRVTGMSKSALYAMVSAGDFPKPARIGRRAVGWRESDVRAWLDSRPEAAADTWA